MPQENEEGKRKLRFTLGKERPLEQETVWDPSRYERFGEKNPLNLAGNRKFPRSTSSVKEIYRLVINQRVFEVVTVYSETHGDNTTSSSPEVTPSSATSTPTHYDKSSVTF